jgi:hypothetical protein
MKTQEGIGHCQGVNTPVGATDRYSEKNPEGGVSQSGAFEFARRQESGANDMRGAEHREVVRAEWRGKPLE